VYIFVLARTVFVINVLILRLIRNGIILKKLVVSPGHFGWQFSKCVFNLHIGLFVCRLGIHMFNRLLLQTGGWALFKLLVVDLIPFAKLVVIHTIVAVIVLVLVDLVWTLILIVLIVLIVLIMISLSLIILILIRIILIVVFIILI